MPTCYTIEDVLVVHDRHSEADAVLGPTRFCPFDLSGVLADAPDTVWLNFRRSYSGFPKFSEALDRSAYWGGTVSFPNLQIAYWLGCPEVYLIGSDHSYTVPTDADVKGAIITSQSDDPNHFHPDYF